MEELARYASVPVINGLTKTLAPLPGDGRHPHLRGASRADPRRARSPGAATTTTSCRRWIDAAQRFDFALDIACPKELAAAAASASRRRAPAARRSSCARTLEAAVVGAAAVISDCWVSMGDEDEGRRHNLLAPYQVNATLMSRAAAGRDLHALPARPSRRGGHRRSDRRAAIGGVRRGREPAARAKGHSRLVPGSARDDGPRPPGRARFPTSDATTSSCPIAVEPLEHARPRRAARPGDRRHPQAPRLSRAGRAASSARRRRSRCCSARRSRWKAASSCRPRPTASADMLVVDFDAPSNLRALARFDEAALADDAALGGAGDLLGEGHLAFTIDPGGEVSRYQGVIALEGQGLEAGGAPLFRALRADPDLRPPRGRRERHARPARNWRAGGLMAQFLPAFAARGAGAPISIPGDAPPGVAAATPILEDDAWIEAKALAATTEDHELIDPTLVERAAALSPVSRARRARLRAAAVARRLPLLGRTYRRDVAAASRARSGPTWSATTARSASPANSARPTASSIPPTTRAERGALRGPMDMKAFADRLARVGAEIEAELDALLSPAARAGRAGDPGAPHRGDALRSVLGGGKRCAPVPVVENRARLRRAAGVAHAASAPRSSSCTAIR